MILEPSTTEVCDVLVIGGGGSGALAALEASVKKELEVVLVSRGPVGQSGLTPTANGGAHVAGPAVDPSQLFEEMVYAGRFLSDQDVIWFMNHAASQCLDKLSALGIPVTRFAPASVCIPSIDTLRRIRHILASRPNVRLLEDMLVTSLLTVEGQIASATVLDLQRGQFFALRAKAVVLATGGMTGELYPHSSNNPFGISTDAAGAGHALAYRAGADLVDMEMIQFVPLPSCKRFLHIRYFPEFWIGPYINGRGEVVEGNVMSYPGNFYSFQLAQKLHSEIEKSNGPIYIDHRTKPPESSGTAIKSWAMRRKLIKQLGIDPLENRIELLLGSHFNTGGVSINPKTETTIPGLFAAGEVTGNIHGALRLAGYSFTQMIVFGFEAGKQAALFATTNREMKSPHPVEVSRERERVVRFFKAENKVSLGNLRSRLQHVMEKHFFIFRNRAGMETGIAEIEAIKEQIPGIAVPSFNRFNLDWVRAIEFDFLVQVAEITAVSALAREESRGFHYRSDFPEEDNKKWLVHTVAQKDRSKLTIRTKPVTITRLRPGE